MSLMRGKKLADYWAWEMTPMPVGLPSWKQLRVGMALVFGLDFVGTAYQRESEREHDDCK